MRAEEGDESVGELADEAHQAKKAIDDAVAQDTRERGRAAPQNDAVDPVDPVDAVDRDLDTPVDEAIGGVPSPPDA